VLLNVFADEIHRAHQRCSLEAECNPHRDIQKLVLEAGESLMRLLQGAYSCICLVKGVGLVAFRDPHGIRCTAVAHILSDSMWDSPSICRAGLWCNLVNALYLFLKVDCTAVALSVIQ